MVNYARHRREIEKLYEDECTISRYVKKQKASGAIGLSEDPQPVYVDQPCRLSQKALGSNDQTDIQNNIAYETKLFISPDITILQGDIIQVTRRRSSIVHTYTAGEPFLYPTHQEVSLQREGKA